MGAIRNKYALNVINSKTGRFLNQIDVFNTPEEALEVAKSLSLYEDEKCNIVCIVYDDKGNEIDADCIY